MKVLIIGSLPKDEELDDEGRESYRQACRDIGKELANRGWPIFIGTFDANTADALVADGAAMSDHSVEVTVYYHGEEIRQFQTEIRRRESQAQRPTFHLKSVEGTWVTGRMEQIGDSEIVLLIGGNEKTAPAFTVSYLLKKPCLPIPGFGGASEEQYYKRFHVLLSQSLKDDEDKFLVSTNSWQGSDSASEVLNFAKRYVDSRPYPDPANDRSLSLVLALGACATLIWMVLFLFFGQSPARGWALFGILATTSVMGATLYWLVLRLLGRSDTQENTRLFFIRVGAAIIEAIVLFILLLVSTGFISGNASILDSLSDRGVFIRFAIIAAVFGFASGFTTEAVAKSLQTRLLKQVSANDNERADQRP